MTNWNRVSQYSQSSWFGVRSALRAGKKNYEVTGALSSYGTNFSCRDGLVNAIREELKRFSHDGEIDLFDDETRQPEKTCVFAAYDGANMAPFNYRRLIHTLDALVAIPALLLNPDRFTGNWWRTSEDELKKVGDYSGNFSKRVRCIAYYGADNTILYHPAMASIVVGLLRQALVMDSIGENKGLDKAVSREDLDSALENGDEKLAWKLAETLRPWIQANIETTRFPIAAGEWDHFRNLHQAIYKNGFRRVFGTIQAGWGLNRLYLEANGVKTFSTDARKKAVEKQASSAGKSK